MVMSNKIEIRPSEKPDKRLKVVYEGKTIHFGSGNLTGKGTYLEHGDDKIKKNWIARHKVREDWNDPKTAGYWSRWVLWNKPTLSGSIKALEGKLNKGISFPRR